MGEVFSSSASYDASVARDTGVTGMGRVRRETGVIGIGKVRRELGAWVECAYEVGVAWRCLQFEPSPVSLANRQRPRGIVVR